MASLLVFFKLSPQTADLQKVKRYNLLTIVMAILLSILFSLKVRASMIDGRDAAWWPILAVTFSPAVMIVTIFVSGILRNFIVFRNKSR